MRKFGRPKQRRINHCFQHTFESFPVMEVRIGHLPFPIGSPYNTGKFSCAFGILNPTSALKFPSAVALIAAFRYAASVSLRDKPAGNAAKDPKIALSFSPVHRFIRWMFWHGKLQQVESAEFQQIGNIEFKPVKRNPDERDQRICRLG